MAIVTVRIQLRRIEGRAPVDQPDLVAAVIEAVEQLEGLELEDTDGETAIYDVTRVTWIDTAPETALPLGTTCGNCRYPVEQVRGGRRRLYCSDACRQEAHRHRTANTE